MLYYVATLSDLVFDSVIPNKLKKKKKKKKDEMVY